MVVRSLLALLESVKAEDESRGSFDVEANDRTAVVEGLM